MGADGVVAGARRRRRARPLAVLASLAFVALGLAISPVTSHVRAASLLAHFAATAPRAIAVDESFTEAGPAASDFRARWYLPRGVRDAPGLLLVHGVHHLGVDEPRLVRFARALAESGILVMTPEIRELADYHVDPRSIATIGEAARRLRERTVRPVGVMGMSFAGGLSLLAAADARYAPDIAFVVAVGAHDDLGRVSRFFATGSIARPDGAPLTMRAHDYGPMVLVYSHVEDFFAEGDVPFARSALRAWLWEDRDAARAHAASMSPEGRAKIGLLFGGHVDAIAPELLEVIARRGMEMGPVSPRGRLGSIHVPVYLLHGAGDSVIPPTETLWLAREVPHAELRDVLVSPALVHVELDGAPTLVDRWSLVHFMADVLDEAHAR